MTAWYSDCASQDPLHLAEPPLLSALSETIASRGGCEPLLLSVVGDDVAGTTLIAHWASLGLSTRGIMRQKGVPTPAVVYCFEQGEQSACSDACSPCPVLPSRHQLQAVLTKPLLLLADPV